MLLTIPEHDHVVSELAVTYPDVDRRLIGLAVNAADAVNATLAKRDIVAVSPGQQPLIDPDQLADGVAEYDEPLPFTPPASDDPVEKAITSLREAFSLMHEARAEDYGDRSSTGGYALWQATRDVLAQATRFRDSAPHRG